MRKSVFFIRHFNLFLFLIMFFSFVLTSSFAQKEVGISSTDGNSGSKMTIYNDPGRDSQGRQKGFSPRDLFGPAPTTSKKPAEEKKPQSYHIEFAGEGEGLEGISMENMRFIPDDMPEKSARKKTHPNPEASKAGQKTSRTPKQNVKRTITPKKVIPQKPKKMTEDEFRKSIGMKPRTEGEKLAETAGKGILILGTLGLLGYALAPAKAAAAVKAGLAAKGASAVVDSSAYVAGSEGAPVGADTGPADFEEGYVTEHQVELPTEPKAGDTRSYTDENGTRWTEVYNGQNWIDSASNDSAINQAADNQAWQEQQRIKQINHDTEFDRQLQQQKIEHQSRLQEIHAKNKAVIRENARIVFESDQFMKEMADKALERVEKVNDILDSGQALADVAVPIAGTFAGPPGWVVGSGYTILSQAGAGAGTALADSSKSILVETAKGVGRGVVNVVVSEGLNSAMAIGSKVLRAGANTIPTGNTFKVSYGQTQFNAPIPTDEVGKMFSNMSRGKALTRGIDSDKAFSSLSSVGKSFFGGEHGLMSEAGSKMAQDSLGKLADSAVSLARGELVDGNVGNFVNSNLWGKG